VWTGSKVIVWGGLYGTAYVSTGGLYDPMTDTWTAMATANAPAGSGQTAVWTGSKMNSGDGKTDIPWREQASGTACVWLMNGAATIGTGYTAAQADYTWTVRKP
jgi:hypothetical protein